MRRLCLTLACAMVVGCSSQPNDLSTPIVPDSGATSDVGESAAIANMATVPEAVPTGVPSAGDTDLMPVAINSGVVALSADNTTIQFVGTHTGAEPNPRVGVFKSFVGTAAMDVGQLKSVSIEIKTDSLETPFDKLNNHLKTADFFDTNVYPTARFQSTSITPIGGEADQISISGNLTLLDSTKGVSFPAVLRTSDEGLTLRGELVIDRTEFGMVNLLDRVNKEVELSFAIGRKTETPQGGSGFGGGGGRRGGGRGNFDPTAMFQQQDADGDGKLTGDEISERMRDNFTETDTDGDGAISLEEFQERIRQFGGGGSRGGGGGDRPPRPE